jgi:hypothetical protein
MRNYEIDEYNTLRMFVTQENENGVSTPVLVLLQEQHPDNRPWHDRDEVEAWALENLSLEDEAAE